MKFFRITASVVVGAALLAHRRFQYGLAAGHVAIAVGLCVVGLGARVGLCRT